jgi:hypothetical protein
LNLTETSGYISGSGAGMIKGASGGIEMTDSIPNVGGTYKNPDINLTFTGIGQFTGTMCSCGELFFGIMSATISSYTISNTAVTFTRQ